MARKDNVRKFKKRRSINLGHIIFLIIFIYIVVSFYFYFTKDHLTIYEVRRGSIAKETVFDGLILRDEEVYNTNMAGYVYYYFKDGDRVSKNSVVYSIDENKNTTSLVTSELETGSLNNEEIARIKHELNNFNDKYDDSNYTAVYDLKYDLNNAAIEIMNEQKQNSLEMIESNGDYFQVVNSFENGVITYYIDDYEKLSKNDISLEHFNLENYNKTLLRNNDIYQTNSPAYKLITDNTWSIIIPLDEEQYNYFRDHSSGEDDFDKVTLNFVGEELECPGSISLFNNGSEYFGEITLDYYMEKFVDQRFVKIEINIDDTSGLKIPASAVIDKEFYLIPHEYFTRGGDSNELGLVLETYDDENELILKFVATEIFFEDEDYSYVNTLLFEPNGWIQSEAGERLGLNEKANLKGVYNVNKGYAVFRRIEIIEESEEYTIVEEGTSYGISVYDQIALVGDTGIEQQIIY